MAAQDQDAPGKREDARSFTTFSGSSPPAGAPNAPDAAPVSAQRTCSKCGQRKDLTEFSPKGHNRHHSRCKICNNQLRKASYQKRNSDVRDEMPCTNASAPTTPLLGPCPGAVADLPQASRNKPPHEVIGTSTHTNQPDETHIEPSEKIDFDIWEKLYNRPLTEMEKIEIKTNVAALLAFLEEESGRRAG